ncbi:MAG: metal ABC transporter permease, partial [Chlamydiae bacterium]|nr:metal ABC transporter permease [Chlamydiota bacterium]
IETLLLILVALCVVIGIRSVGVVLLSAMFIAPATAARQFTDKLLNMFWMAALVGAFSALAGVYLSVKYALPTGPIVAIVAGGVAISSLIISPKRRRARASLQRA